MFGVAGLIDYARPGDHLGFECRARAMAGAIIYLGPDGFDVGSDAEAGVALAHRRLAIIDLTPTGAHAWRLLRHMRIHDGETKWLLRRVLSRFVPANWCMKVGAAAGPRHRP
jgi:asparagine synthetase B (glutamine-hydrolysing)